MAEGRLDTDYLVVGSGATAMAFVDTLLDETDSRVVMVDRRDHPGGHWNDAYPFVRLHQPSASYGVGSRELGGRVKYRDGPNAGSYELASKAEILDYYDQVMRQRFLPSGRVTWLPMSEYRRAPDGRHHVTSLLGGSRVEVVVHRKLVDATLARTEIPATHGPRYRVMAQAQVIPVNQLPGIRRRHPCYTVVGAGKTGMDACMWLLTNGVEPARIRWVRSRDPWILDRASVQPFAENFDGVMQRRIDGFRAIAEATSPANLFDRLESSGVLMRLDPDVEPRAFRAAILSRGELDELRRIEDVVRLGRVTTIEPQQIVLEHGTVAAEPDTLYIDCSSAALQPAPDRAVFEPGVINLVMTRFAQPVFSAALTGFIESRFDDDAEKNAMCRVVPTPNVPLDWLAMWPATLANAAQCAKRPAVADWISRSRLDLVGSAQRGLDPVDPRREQLHAALSAAVVGAVARLPHLLAGRVDAVEHFRPQHEGEVVDGTGGRGRWRSGGALAGS